LRTDRRRKEPRPEIKYPSANGGSTRQDIHLTLQMELVALDGGGKRRRKRW